jgi:hypothetical protein
MAFENGSPQRTPTSFELRFQSLSDPGRGRTFPCDAGGNVDMDRMSDQARNSYLGARALIGREYAFPVVAQKAELAA